MTRPSARLATGAAAGGGGGGGGGAAAAGAAGAAGAAASAWQRGAAQQGVSQPCHSRGLSPTSRPPSAQL
jgi:hypothetical protein